MSKCALRGACIIESPSTDCESHHAPPARFRRARALPRDRPDPGARRPHGRAPARRLGRRRDPGADARAHARRRHARRPGRLRLPVHAPQQALDHAEPQGARGHRGAQEAGRQRRRAGRELPPRREDAAGHRLRDARDRSTRGSSTRASPASARPGPTPRAPASTRSRRAWAASCRSRACRARARCAWASRSPTCARGIFAAYGVTVALLERESLGQGPVAAHLAAGIDDLHDGFPDLALDDRRRGRRGRRATSTPPASRPASTGRRTATSTSPSSAARSGSASARRWARRSGSPTSARRPRPARSRATATGSTPRSRSASRADTSDHWIEKLNEAGVACGRINNIREVFEEPQVQHLGMLQEGDVEAAGRAAPHGPARHARAHALHHRARRPAPRRAHRGDPRRGRLRPRGPRPHEIRRSLLMNDIDRLRFPHRAREGLARRGRRCTSASTTPRSTTRSRWTCGRRCRRCSRRPRRTTPCAWSSSPARATKSFVSGADISQFEDMRAAREAVKRYELMAEAALMGIHDFGKPTHRRHPRLLHRRRRERRHQLRHPPRRRRLGVRRFPATRLGLGYRFSALKNLVDLVGPGARQGHLLHRAAPRRRGGAAPSGS